ncbi:MAG: sulfite oxidase-like oxidoreductase [Planctomycetota bacterium]|nr:MAG: sulfite oxidase-like oxidoreductase [Planctomycetota bacterium]
MPAHSPDGDSVVDRRLRFMEKLRRRQASGKEAENALGSGPANAHGLPELPVGQRAVENWPVLDLGDLPRLSTDNWSLEIGGLVARPQSLDWSQFQALPQVEQVSDFHCVTTWSRLKNRWHGVRFLDLAAACEPRDEASHVFITAYDHDRQSGEAYTTNLPLAEALHEDVLLVHRWQDRPLPPEHGGPVRMITPRLYAWKGAKWIRKIEFLDRDRLGFWERRGYSNTANPWSNDRYA